MGEGSGRAEEIRDHLALAGECLEEAENLLSGGLYRGAVSRAYYSMYHAARALLLTKNIAPKKHAGVLKMLGLESSVKDIWKRFMRSRINSHLI
ncbi:HEPN domain-containing protein [Geoglobus acetivorans]|uniref:HEPN domain-containing protein n=1 Tax=Geoglobus acetivorans TaxID=565033 RepID=A0ABZ3H2A9_GEOAI